MKKISVSILFMLCSTASFADQPCQGILTDLVISNNLTVKSECKLARVKVEGNIILTGNAALTLLNSEIKGNIEAKTAFNTINATNNNITGNIDLKQGKNIRLLGNNIGGNLQIEKSKSSAFVQNNRISGNLKCTENASPLQGGQNYVQGDKEQQCLSL